MCGQRNKTHLYDNDGNKIELEQSDGEKDIGLLVDETLSFNKHIQNPYKLIRPYDRCGLISNGCSGLIYLCGLRQMRPYIKWKRIIKK